MPEDETEAALTPDQDPVVGGVDDDDDDTLRIVSVLGGSRRVGRWRIPSSTSVMALFGRTTIDLREVESQASEIEIRCLSVFAGVTILVPKGADVRPAGMVILAATSCDIPATEEPSSLPPVIITSTTVLGTLHIQTGERAPRGRRRGRRDRSRAEPAWDVRPPVAARQAAEPAGARAASMSRDVDAALVALAEAVAPKLEPAP